ncbi:anti-sigma factor family protein [Bradyrhizobium sp. SYSU BS000235]|uniref:anti-sigma factor family protein n=1 Tax=Bradyrhizobium sp. SYSU BS000235 TaxID=3411332 RepID=UPI003C7310FD
MTSSDTKPCAEWELMLHGFIDGELDASHSLRFEQHLASCPHCSNQLEGFQALRKTVAQKGVRWQTPEHVRAQVLAAIAREAAMQTRSPVAAASGGMFRIFDRAKQWLFVPSLAALAASLFIVMSPMRDRSSIEDQIVASHVRSLLVDHLTDVATSDRHTVKPWFNGKIDFSPPVVDLAPQGFPLVGGRVDYIGGRVVAALVYRRHGHFINVFVWPAPSATETTAMRDGYNMANWTKDGLNFWAVSDVNSDDIAKFRDAFVKQTSSG